MSGRSLRRLPVLAHARYIGTLPASSPHTVAKISGVGPKKGIAPGGHSVQGRGAAVETWLDAMERVVESQATERSRFGK